MSAVTGTRTAVSRQAAALAFERAFPTPACAKATSADVRNVVAFYPTAHPGVEAPLGWTLSSYSQSDLVEQFANHRNQDELEVVKSWFK